MTVFSRGFAALPLVAIAMVSPPTLEGARGGSLNDRGFQDFIQFDGIYYGGAYRGTYDGEPAPLERADLGPLHGYTKYQPDPAVDDPDEYLPNDGDASFLPPGTPVYEVTGHAPWFRLAAHRNGEIVTYEAARNPRAERGGDLLDIAGKVEWIGVLSMRDGRLLAAIREPAEVDRLVEMVLMAPVPHPTWEVAYGPDYRVVFRLADGTDSVRFFSIERNLLGPYIAVPAEFGDAIVRAVRARAGLDATPAAAPTATATPFAVRH